MTDKTIRNEKMKRLRSWLILAGVLIFVALVALIKNVASERKWFTSELASARLEEYRAAGKPTVVFFHSPDCSACNKVQVSLNEVYPEFSDRLALLNVDVTNKRERDFVDQSGVLTTPSLLLADAAGNDRLIVGEISIVDLRTALSGLAGGNP